jgi:hypothetical protein
MSKSKKENSNPLRATTPKFRVSFPQLFEAKAMEEGQEPKYSVTMLFPKDTDLSALEEAYDAAVAKGMEDKWKGKKPKNLRNPFRDGDEDENYCDKDGYPGHIFVRASTKTKPGVIATDVDPSTGKRRVIDDPQEVYAGCYARATVVAYPYDVAGNKGIAFGLQNLQKLEDGESFSGAKSAEDDFDDEYDEDDDFE